MGIQILLFAVSPWSREKESSPIQGFPQPLCNLAPLNSATSLKPTVHYPSLAPHRGRLATPRAAPQTPHIATGPLPHRPPPPPRTILQRPQVLRRNKPPPQIPRRVPPHSLPVRHQHKHLAKPLPHRLPPLPKRRAASHLHQQTHLRTILVRAGNPRCGRANGEGGVDGVGVEGLDLEAGGAVLGEELVIGVGVRVAGAVDGDVGGEGERGVGL